jgi:uncharacterized protein involved in exopolysaccharide biosynthesis
MRKLNPQTKQDRAELRELQRRLKAEKREFARTTKAQRRSLQNVWSECVRAHREADAKWKKSDRVHLRTIKALRKGSDRAVAEIETRIAVITGRLSK